MNIEHRTVKQSHWHASPQASNIEGTRAFGLSAGCAVFLAVSAGVMAAEPKLSEAEKAGYEIMQKNYAQVTTKNFRSDVTMQLVEPDGKVQTRHLKRISKTSANDLEKYLLIFSEPPAIRNTALLVIENADRDDDVWFYLPALKKTKRISGSNMRASYMGTEFSFKDLKREKIGATMNKYVLLRSEQIDGVDHFVVDASPVSDKEKSEQGYKFRRIWLRKDNYLSTRVEFYGDDGELVKTLVSSDMRDVGKSGKVRYHHLVMTNKKGVKTILDFKMMRIDEEDPDEEFFTQGYLLRSR